MYFALILEGFCLSLSLAIIFSQHFDDLILLYSGFHYCRELCCQSNCHSFGDDLLCSLAVFKIFSLSLHDICMLTTILYGFI